MYEYALDCCKLSSSPIESSKERNAVEAPEFLVDS